jgi:hypothetical protein
MSQLSNSISKYIPFVARRPKIDRNQALAIIPVRNPLIEWERNGKEIHLSIPMRDDRLARFIKRFVRNLPERRRVALDEVGATVWELCNGQRNVNAIVESVCKNYKLTRREAEASVTMFLQTLAKRNYVALMSFGGSKGAKRK